MIERERLGERKGHINRETHTAKVNLRNRKKRGVVPESAPDQTVV